MYITRRISSGIHKRLRYSSEKDFVPVVQIATSPTVLVVAKEFPEEDLKGLIRYVKANTGKVHFASGGIPCRECPNVTTDRFYLPTARI